MLKTVVEMAKEITKTTRGAFDPAVAPLLSFYKERAKQYATFGDKNKRLSIYELSEEGEETYDANALRRTKEAVRAFQNVLNLGFASDPNGEMRISKKAKKLLEISNWSAAFSIHKNFLSKKNPDAKLELSGIVSH
jgi:thiamine biosynthesis lipoprotein ApbE